MTQSRLTVNVNCSYVKDWNKTITFLKALDPVAVVAVIDNKANRNRVHEIKQALPNAKIIVRCIIVVEGGKQLDGAMHLKPKDANYWLVSPGNFLDEWGEFGKDGYSLSYFNEPQTSDASAEDVARQVQHMIETIGLATQRNISLVVGNWGVGQAPTDSRFDDVYEIVSKQRDLHSLGCHLYAPVDTFHAIEHVITRSKAKGFAYPRIYVTEFGFDNAGAGDTLNGYRSRGISGVQFADWCKDKIANVYNGYLRDGILEAVAVFGWGYAVSYPAFDVETDTDWQTTILDAHTKGLLTVPNKPVTKPFITPMPKPIDATDAIKVRITNAIGINLRSGAGTEYQVSRTLAKGSEVTLYRSPFKQDTTTQVWRWVEVSETEGGWINTDAASYELITPVGVVTGASTSLDNMPVVITLPPPTTNEVSIPSVSLPPPVSPLPAETWFIFTAAQRAEFLGHLLALTTLLQNAQESDVSPTAKAA